MRYFCTYFDSNFLTRGTALYMSLAENHPDIRIYALCMDKICHDVLSKARLPGLYPVRLEDFEEGDEALAATKKSRTAAEYYFTCTPSLMIYIFRRHPEIDLLTYLDADLLFFGDPEPLFGEMGGGSVAVIEHRPHAGLESLVEKYGKYNVGWLSFRRDETALACLGWWRDRCIEWCCDTPENGRFADQKYLDDWPALFRGVVVLRHPGACLAPWNVAGHGISKDGPRLRVDGQSLVFFHFHGFSTINRWFHDPWFSAYKVRPSSVLRRDIYGRYIRSLEAASKRLSDVLPRGFRPSGSPRIGGTAPGISRLPAPGRFLRLLKGAVAKEYLFSINGFVL